MRVQIPPLKLALICTFGALTWVVLIAGCSALGTALGMFKR